MSETTPLVFRCEGCELVGILHRTAQPATRGVLVLVGGPQYRVGSHRQFVHLARSLADAGFPVLRFDYRGMGDSEGHQRDFELIREDIGAAINAFTEACPDLRQIVIWGLCDAASAAIFYAARDPRVAGLILLNPWVRTEHTLARSYLSHYYGQRFLQRDFWAKLLGGRMHVGVAIRSFLETLRRGAEGGMDDVAGETAAAPLPVRMLGRFTNFSGRSLIILSENDLTAGEFAAAAREPRWQEALAGERVRQLHVAAADHTFSRETWKETVASACREWLRTW